MNGICTESSRANIAIIGGGTGGCAAALAAWSMGRTVIMTEEVDWIGGQLTSQAVPPDENLWSESFGSNRRYHEFRNRVRQYYRDHFPLSASARRLANLNPGNGWVSWLCYQPEVGYAVLRSMFAEALNSGRLEIRLHRRPIAVATEKDVIRAVTLLNMDSGAEEVIEADYVLDATELGDLLPLANVEYVTGAESQAETGEPHALAGDANPEMVQGLTWCLPLAMDDRPGADHTIARPAQYDRWRRYAPQRPDRPYLSWLICTDSARDEWMVRGLFDGDEGFRGLWPFRQIVCADHYDAVHRPQAATIVNWPQNDYFVESPIDTSYNERQRIYLDAKQLSLSLVYWMQTEAPRHDSDRCGYPELYLRPDLVGTTDGLAQAPYIRESRRIKAEFTVLEQHVSANLRRHARDAEPFADSVGIGCYGMDIHHCVGGGANYHMPVTPFQIPLGALLPVRMENLLPACKNLGVTHLTNGCYRLHPVEWNIGEAAGLLAAFALQRKTRPRAVRSSPALLADFQALLSSQGIPLHWPWATEQM